MDKILDNKVAIVTGAGSGIGRAVALLYAAAGAKVVVSDINEVAGRETTAQIIAAGDTGMFIRADTSRAEENQALVDATVEAYGGLHVACNNAGIGGSAAMVGDTAIEEWNRVVGVNLSGVFYGMRYQIPAMLKSGGGAIVNMGSILSQVAMREYAPYVAAKHGLMGLTRTAALEYGPQNIRINTVGPAFIKTPLLDNLSDDMLKGLATLHPVGRLGEATEVAELTLWLSSEKASFITGAYYPIDGGYLSQ